MTEPQIYEAHVQVGLALAVFADSCGPFIRDTMQAEFGDDWVALTSERLRRHQIPSDGDPAFLLDLVRRFWPSFERSGWSEDDRDAVEVLRVFRNRWAHHEMTLPSDAAASIDACHQLCMTATGRSGRRAFRFSPWDALRKDLGRDLASAAYVRDIASQTARPAAESLRRTVKGLLRPISAPFPSAPGAMAEHPITRRDARGATLLDPWRVVTVSVAASIADIAIDDVPQRFDRARLAFCLTALHGDLGIRSLVASLQTYLLLFGAMLSDSGLGSASWLECMSTAASRQSNLTFMPVLGDVGSTSTEVFDSLSPLASPDSELQLAANQQLVRLFGQDAVTSAEATAWWLWKLHAYVCGVGPLDEFVGRRSTVAHREVVKRILRLSGEGGPRLAVKSEAISAIVSRLR